MKPTNDLGHGVPVAYCRSESWPSQVTRSFHFPGFDRVGAALDVISVACSGGAAKNEKRNYRYGPEIGENWVDVATFKGDLRNRGLAACRHLGRTGHYSVVMLRGNCGPAKRHSPVLDTIAGMRRLVVVVVLHFGRVEWADQEERGDWRRVGTSYRLIRLVRHDDVAA
jgi:hypothetical protein